MAEHIEREALLEDIDAAQKNGGMGDVVAGTLKRYVKRQPAADVVPVRHGQWRSKTVLTDWLKYTAFYECSVCARGMEKIKYDFCPNCGARMDGRQ